MWIRTAKGIVFIEMEQTHQGLWMPKTKANDSTNTPATNV